MKTNRPSFSKKKKYILAGNKKVKYEFFGGIKSQYILTGID